MDVEYPNLWLNLLSLFTKLLDTLKIKLGEYSS